MNMDWTPLFEAPWFLQVHAIAAMAGFVLGAIQLIAPKGTLPHKVIGVIWLVLLALVAGTSWMTIWMFEIIRFSPIHILSAITTWGLIGGIRHLFQTGENFKKHAGPFRAIFIFGLLIAGVFTFMPGRIMHEVVFGG